MMVDTILFDFGGVLLDLDYTRTYDAMQGLLGCELDLSEGSRHRKVLDEYEKGLMSSENFLWHLQHWTDRSLPVPDAPTLIKAWNAMLLGWRPEKLQLLSDLKKSHRLFLLSNTNALHLEWVHRDLATNHGIRDFENRFFENAFYSHVLKDRKPNISCFEQVVSLGNIAPSRTLFIDDNESNIETAAGLGFQTHLHPANASLEFLRS